MTRYDKLKRSTLEEVANSLCYLIGDIFEACDKCPASNMCYIGHTGMKDFLMEEEE